jgi:hypothetical protein
MVSYITRSRMLASPMYASAGSPGKSKATEKVTTVTRKSRGTK